MATGRYVSDLEEGDVLGPVEYTISRFVIREYAHAVELHQDFFQHRDGQIAPPTMVHLDKLRLYRHACPAGTGPHARVHVEYDATVHAPVPADTRLVVSGHVSGRYVKRGREYVHMDIEMKEAASQRPLVSYRDTVILSYSGESSKKADAA